MGRPVPVSATRRRKDHCINVSEHLYDALVEAGIDGPEGWRDRLSLEQVRKLTRSMSDDSIASMKAELTAANLDPFGDGAERNEW